MDKDPNDYHTTTGEVAAVMRVSEAAVRGWCEAGTIPALRAGERKRWRIRNDWQDVFRARLEDRRPEPPPHQLPPEPDWMRR